MLEPKPSNGIDIREFDRNEYFKLFSPAFQEVEVFAFPLCENVSMQLTGNTDKQKAEKFLRAAGMGDKLDKLPKGIDTQMLKVLYDDGVDLSGGEIENIARKHSVSAILSGREGVDLDEIIADCRCERISQNSRTRIGF